MVRRVLLPLLVVGAAAAFAPGAFAAVPPCHPVQPLSLSSAHFLVTFNGDPNNGGAGPAVSAQQAGLVLASAEQSYNAMQAMGFPAPAVTGSGKTEIHILDLASFNVSSFNCNGEIDFNSGTIDDANGRAFSAAFDLFEEIEYGYGGIDGWLMQGAASWAAWKSLGYPTASTADIGPWELSMDCQYTAFDSKNCSTIPYENLGLSRWPFYEYLAERFGTTFMSEVLTDVQSAGDGLTGLQTALTAHGTTLDNEYNLFAARVLKGGWSAQQLNLATPPASATIQTGVLTGDLPPQTFGVDHLASRVIQIDRGDGSAAKTCYAATLKLTVTMPNGVTSQPVFIWKVPGAASVPLAVSGNTATATIPWDTCSWTSHGYLVLPNASTTANAALFTLAAHLDVTATEVTAKPPTGPANGYGNATDVGSAQVAPLITVFGPLAMHLPSTATRLRLVVEANAQGAVNATLGSNDLGQSAVVPGENVLTFNLPAGILRSLRTTSAANNVLTLSPVSQDGQVTGTARTMTVVVTKPAAKPKQPKKPKHKK
jgi:hypothetical protein